VVALVAASVVLAVPALTSSPASAVSAPLSQPVTGSALAITAVLATATLLVGLGLVLRRRSAARPIPVRVAQRSRRR
jgi:hypothetical protein